MIFRPFDKQRQFLKSKARIRFAACGKRAGKSEIGAIDAIIHAEQRPGYVKSDVDPYIVIIMAPTSDMLRRLSLKKFMGYAKPFGAQFHKTHNELQWPNGSVIYGLSADRPERLEGIKANYIWLDEAFQMQEQIFLECLARLSDTKGRLTITGSLGTQYRNPKSHWLYKRFKENPISESECFEWSTSENPYFPKDELLRLQDTLDPISYRQMFEICWDVQGTNLVFDNFSEANIQPTIAYNPNLETSVSIDWGYRHKMACLYYQYDRHTDTVYQIDEIVGSKLTLDVLWEKMQAKPYRINNYYCDIAGSQEREQTGISNITWFKNSPRNIHFKYKTMGVANSLVVARSYICNAKGQRKFYIAKDKCPKTIDAILNFSYDEKNGAISSEIPTDKPDEADALRYYFGNRHDFMRIEEPITELNRWKLLRG